MFWRITAVLQHLMDHMGAQQPAGTNNDFRILGIHDFRGKNPKD